MIKTATIRWTRLHPESHGCLPEGMERKSVLLAYPDKSVQPGFSDFECWVPRHKGQKPTFWAAMPEHPEAEN